MPTKKAIDRMKQLFEKLFCTSFMKKFDLPMKKLLQIFLR